VVIAQLGTIAYGASRKAYRSITPAYASFEADHQLKHFGEETVPAELEEGRLNL